ncbi:MAG: hypothetical protein CMI09_16475 [Oceanospirillaceae bacterium]|nr:hypothetical protein [Oceanospirillaceae bacterium]|tara:strand:- start:112 stop:504 length:393 start_codon:yes stop_codon:yes gene_type:complete
MELLKGLIGQGLELTIHEDGVHLLVGSVNGLTHQQRETIQTNRERLLDELRLRTPMGQYHKAGDLPLPLLPEDAHFINGTLAYRPTTSAHQLLNHYLREWMWAAASEPLEQKKENAGRKAANAWLRDQQH